MENNGQKWYVYAHINPINGETFYIGKGTGKRGLAPSGRNPSWKVYVGGLESKGLTYAIHILHICDSEDDALDMECIEIHKRLEAGQSLLNKMLPPLRKDEPITASEIVNSNSIELIQFVKLKRKSLKLTQKQTSDRSGVGYRFLRELETGKQTLRMDKVNEVLRLFGSKLVPK